MLIKANSEKVIKISNVVYKSPALPEFQRDYSMQSHLLRASLSPQRLAKQLWHLRIRGWAPSWLSWPDSSLCISSNDLHLPDSALCFGPEALAHLCWRSQTPLCRHQSRPEASQRPKVYRTLKKVCLNTMIFQHLCVFHAPQGRGRAC